MGTREFKLPEAVGRVRGCEVLAGGKVHKFDQLGCVAIEPDAQREVLDSHDVGGRGMGEEQQ